MIMPVKFIDLTTEAKMIFSHDPEIVIWDVPAHRGLTVQPFNPKGDGELSAMFPNAKSTVEFMGNDETPAVLHVNEAPKDIQTMAPEYVTLQNVEP
jgi:hypothetical protein